MKMVFSVSQIGGKMCRNAVGVLALLTIGSLSAAASAQTLTPSSATIEDLNAAFDAGTLTSERLVELYLARIEAYNQQGPALNAILWLNDAALATARALDAERTASGPRSPLHGIPVVLKDNIDTFDMPTTAGSLLLVGSIPPDDAFIVKKLRDAGAIILAKLNMSEFASGVTMSSVGGFIRNPHDPARSPAGSSGGTGAGIAAAFAQLGVGTDTGGSVRQPAGYCGVVGLKPTYGRVSRYGLVAFASSLDQIGPVAKDVADAALKMDIGVIALSFVVLQTVRMLTKRTRVFRPRLRHGAGVGLVAGFTSTLARGGPTTPSLYSRRRLPDASKRASSTRRASGRWATPLAAGPRASSQHSTSASAPSVGWRPPPRRS